MSIICITTHATAPIADAVSGEYQGYFACTTAAYRLNLTLSVEDNGEVNGELNARTVASLRPTPDSTQQVTGRYDPATGALSLSGSNPLGRLVPQLAGLVTPNGEGWIALQSGGRGQCSPWVVSKNQIPLASRIETEARRGAVIKPGAADTASIMQQIRTMGRCSDRMVNWLTNADGTDLQPRHVARALFLDALFSSHFGSTFDELAEAERRKLYFEITVLCGRDSRINGALSGLTAAVLGNQGAVAGADALIWASAKDMLDATTRQHVQEGTRSPALTPLLTAIAPERVDEVNQALAKIEAPTSTNTEAAQEPVQETVITSTQVAQQNEPISTIEVSNPASTLTVTMRPNTELSRRALRTAAFGQLIHEGEDYDLYSPQAVPSDSGFVCDPTIARNANRTEAEWRAESLELNQPREAERARVARYRDQRLTEEIEPLKQQIYARYETGSDELRAAFQEVQALAAPIEHEYQQEIQFIDIDYQPRFMTARGELAIYALHRRDDDATTIVPLQELNPTPTFVEELGQRLTPFLSTCPNVHRIGIGHAWADYVKPVKRGLFTVVAYDYRTIDGILQLMPRDSDRRPATHYPSRNPYFTLAGLFGVTKQQWIKSGDYRSTFRSASARQPGIVYKYDAWWRENEITDVPRRVFEGRFEGIANHDEMKAWYHALAGTHTQMCTAAAGRTTFRWKTRCYDRDEFGIDGSRTRYWGTCDHSVAVDPAFAQKWREFWPGVDAFRAARIGIAIRYSKQRGGVDWTRSGLSRLSDEMGFMREVGPMRALFEADGCNGPIVSQLRENLQRIAHGRPSLQDSGGRIEGAEAASDPPLEP